MPVGGPAVPTSARFWWASHPRPACDPQLAARPVDVSSHKSPTDGFLLLLVSSQPNLYSQSLADPNQSPSPAARSPSSAQIICSQVSSLTSRHTLDSHLNHLFCSRLFIMNISLCMSHRRVTNVLKSEEALSSDCKWVWGLQQIWNIFWKNEKRNLKLFRKKGRFSSCPPLGCTFHSHFLVTVNHSSPYYPVRCICIPFSHTN